MREFFSAEPSQTFQLFATPHKLVLLGLIVGAVLIYVFRHVLRQETPNRWSRYALVFLIATTEVSLSVWRISVGKWDIQTSLPLHLCGISMILCIVVLLNNNYRLFELTYFWGLVGAFVAMVTPELEASYNNYRFWQFFLGHTWIIYAVWFMIVVEKYRPVKASIIGTFAVTNGYMLIIGLFNFLTGANYLYIAHKPEAATPLDYLGPWPWYVVGMEILAIILFALYYLPYAIKDMAAARRGRISARA